MRLYNRDIETILAALRTFQSLQRHSADIANIATDGGRHAPMNDEEIDDLCERLNCDEIDSDDAVVLLEASKADMAAYNDTTVDAVEAALPQIRNAISHSTVPDSVNDIVFNILTREQAA